MKTIILALVSLLICATLCITVSADYQKITSTASGLTLENENVIFSFDDEGVVTEYTYRETAKAISAQEAISQFFTIQSVSIFPPSLP